MQAALLEAVEAIRPALQVDGGDMNVLRLDEETGVVDIELVGACDGCPMSSMTLKAGIERILKDRVPGLNEVRAKGIDFDTLDDDVPAMGTPVAVDPLAGGSASFS
ncbi:MAG TPA: NifU family protein [Acidimicrobiales bacterium]|nr:NifU family protein [Acidimicrobiales bacterium]